MHGFGIPRTQKICRYLFSRRSGERWVINPISNFYLFVLPQKKKLSKEEEIKQKLQELGKSLDALVDLEEELFS